MPNNPKIDRVLARIEPGRREAMRRILVGAAYTAPVVASFSMTSLDAVAQSRCANQTINACFVEVPTTSQWTLAAMAGALGAAGAWILRRRRQR
jgi:hypothetical protein